MDSRPGLDLHSDVATLTAQLIEIPSVSHNEALLADLVQEALTTLSHVQVDRLGNTVVARTEGGLAQRVVLGGHLDTVPPADNGSAQFVAAGEPVPVVGPDGVTVASEDRLYGLGACDMKGGVAVALKLAYELTSPTRDITYVFYEGEEVATEYNGLGHIVSQRPELLAGADLAVMMEPSEAGVEAGCQGTLRFIISTEGTRAHSARSWLGKNAIHDITDVLQRLSGYRPREVVIDGLVYREGLNAVKIEGGVAANVIPDRCRVTINYRFAPNSSVADAVAHMSEVFSGYDFDLDDAAPGALPGLHHDATRDFVSATGDQPRPKFGWTDVARFSELGVPAVNYGPGSPGLAHSRHEYVPIEELHRVHGTLRRWLTS